MVFSLLPSAHVLSSLFLDIIVRFSNDGFHNLLRGFESSRTADI
jgi:hypothetical protein